MAITQIRGNVQIMAGTITNTEISASAAIATSKLADGAEFLKRDGSVALTGNLDADSNRIVNLAAPVSANDAARLADVQAASNGLTLKAPVRVKSTGSNVSLANDLQNGDSLDGVTLATGDRVLLTDQTDPTENGIYVVVASGAASRSPDADSNAEVEANMFCWVEEGTLYADSGWALITNNPITLGSTSLTFTQFSGGSSLVTGAANIGATGVGVFSSLNGSTLEFRKIDSASSGKVTVTLNGNKIDLDIGAGTLVNADISASAAIARSKIAAGTANHVIINDGSGNLSSEAVLAVSRGGTNSSASLSNNRVMISSGGAIVEASAITANRALVSDTNGIPVASSVTDTELGYLSGVTSAIQTQLNSKYGAANFVTREVPSGSINGSNTNFSLANTPVSGSEEVFLNGLLQNVGGSNDYTISGTTISFNSAPLSGDVILVNYRK